MPPTALGGTKARSRGMDCRSDGGASPVSPHRGFVKSGRAEPWWNAVSQGAGGTLKKGVRTLQI